MLVPVISMAGKKVGEVELSDTLFSAPVNEPLMHQALLRQLANARLGTAKVKGRSEVAGGGRKPWKQKGTGRARQGSTRAAQWRGGGIIFGPAPRSYEQKMPRRMRHAALCSALTIKAAEDRIVVLDRLASGTVGEPPKTRDMAAAMARVVPEGTALVLWEPAGVNENLPRAASNLANVKLLRAGYLNMRDLLDYDYLVIPQDVLPVLEGVLS
jgi:large subunit ribosomal protein L4